MSRGFVLFGVLSTVVPLSAWTEWMRLLFLVTVPLSVLVAVTRYRLYELDRVISRTVGYSVVSTVLVGVYAVVVIMPSAVFSLESDLLVAAGAFVPVRRRVQAAVDRRFNRARHDAARVVERFGARRRNDLGLDGLHADLRDVVTVTVQPTHVSLLLSAVRDRR